MKKYKTINELHAAIEKKADKIIKYYYTDFKNYDRPEIMRHTGAKTREVYLILRESGSYIYSLEELLNLERDFPAIVMDYYTSDKTAHYYKQATKNHQSTNRPPTHRNHPKKAYKRKENRKQ